MATHSSILAWRIPWTEEPDCYSLWGCKESDMTERLTLALFPSYYPEINPMPSVCGMINHVRFLMC